LKRWAIFTSSLRDIILLDALNLRSREVSLSTSVTIRQSTPADAPVIAEFNALLARETEHLTLDRNRLGAGVEAVLRDPARGIYWVAEAGGEIVGQLMITFEWSDWRNGFFWWIQSVYVRQDWRARGVFRALYERVHREAKSRADVCGLRLYVERENQLAHRTYERLGLRPTSYDFYEVDFRIAR
jgi:GNAT superfamily N-acetyltransferase